VYTGCSFIYRNCRCLLLIFVLTVTARPVTASEQADPVAATKILNVDQLITWVRERNPGLEQLRAAVEEAAARVVPAGSLDDPRLSYSLAPATIDGFRRANGTSGGFNQRIELSQAIPWPGTLNLREEEARSRSRAAEYRLADQHLQIIAAIKAAYAEWYYVHRALDINESNQTLLIELRNIAETRYTAGRAGQQDVLQTEVRHASLEEQHLALERQRRSIQAQLNALLNRPAAETLPPPGTVPAPGMPPVYEQLQARALSAHPELMRLQAELRAGEARIDLAEKRFFPNFKIMAGYNSLWDQGDKRWTIGAAVNIPFDRKKYNAELRAARSKAMQLRWRLADRRNRLLADMEQARAQVGESVRVIQLYRDRLVPLAGESLDAAVAEYRAGQKDFLNVITAEDKKLATELGLERARADYLRRLAELERWTGDILKPVSPSFKNTEDPAHE